MLDKAFWDEKYKASRMGWNIGYPSTPLATFMDVWSDKTAHILIPGAGNAYEAEYLHQKGFSNVFVLDWSTWALEGFHKRVPDFPVDHLISEDFFAHESSYDLILEQTFFCAIDPSLRETYVKHMYHLLKPGGWLAGVLFNAPMNADRPPFGGSANEYRTLFSPLFTFKSFAPCYNSIPERAGNEWFIALQKPENGQN